MKVGILILALVAWMPSQRVAAQTGGDCVSCAGTAECETKHASCDTECRARFFSIDPKRAECFGQCKRSLVRCTKTASTDCGSRNVCR